MENKVTITDTKENIYHKQIQIMWMYFKALPNEKTRDEFMSFLNMINNLSQKSHSKEEIKDEVIKRYFYSKDDNDFAYIMNFTNNLKNIKCFNVTKTQRTY